MNQSESSQILDELEKLTEKVDKIDDKSERTWRAIAGDEAIHSKGLGERVEENEYDIRSLKKDRTKVGAFVAALFAILGALGIKIIDVFKN